MRVGNLQRIDASNVMVVGNHNTIIGNNNLVTGNHNKMTGNNNHVTGNHNKMAGNDNLVTGNHNTTQGDNNMCTGSFNASLSGSVAIDMAPDSVWNNAVVNIQGKVDIQGIFAMGDVICYEKTDKKQLFIECPLESEPDTPIPDDAPDGTPACVVCTANAPSCVILPCMHKSLCCACGRALTAEGTKQRGQLKCPMCQGEVHKIARVFE
jgi:hypothetical protein